MKKLLILVAVIVVLYFLYVNVIAPSKEAVSKKVEDKIFNEPYSQVNAAKQVEAKTWAQFIINKQEEYCSVNGRYASNLKELGFVPRIGEYYTGKVISADENNFIVHLKANLDSDTTIDVWEVNKDGFRNLVNDASQ